VTLISVHNSEGCVGRCDARCYDAIHADCDCVCGGSNHGKGEAQAVANTAAHAEEWVKAIEGQTGAKVRFEVGVPADQMGITWE